MTPQQITVMFLSLGILLGLAHILGEISRKLGLPAIVGELLAGVLLGPTVLRNVAPGIMGFLFPIQGNNALALDSITTLTITLFLLVAGIKVDLSTIWKQGKLGIKIGFSSLSIPFFWICRGTLIPRYDGTSNQFRASDFRTMPRFNSIGYIPILPT